MLDRTNLAYACDGSFWGMLCCVFDSYTRREIPQEILEWGEPSFYPVHQVETVEEHAQRVWRSLNKISGQIRRWAEDIYFSCVPQRAMVLYRFIRKAYQYGAKVTSMLGDEDVMAAYRLSRSVGNETHFMEEFLRFSEYNGILVAVIHPKTIVLPRIAHHFSDRFPEETFLIHDQPHEMALFYHPYQMEIYHLSELELPPVTSQEAWIQSLWKGYYTATGIQGRLNPKCRMTHMPKRFWKQVLELEHPCLKGKGETPSLKTPAHLSFTDE